MRNLVASRCVTRCRGQGLVRFTYMEKWHCKVLTRTSPQLLWPCWRVGTTLPVSNVTCHHWVARLWQHSRPDSQRRLAASWRRCAAPPARLVTPLENNLACSIAFVGRHEIAAEFSLLCCCIAVVRGFGLRCSGCRR
jgi:hypothetical protein